MTDSRPFYDLCISDQCLANQPFTKTAKRLLEYGYKTIAISRFLDEETLKTKKGNKKKKGENRNLADIIPHPVSIPNLSDFQGLKILQRLTVSFSDNETLQNVLRSSNLKKYDIIAVIPMNQQSFQFACTTIDIDIISFDPEGRSPVKLTRKLYNLAVTKGIYFEIMYSPAISSPTVRKNIINMSHLYHSYGKSKSIILTSWASNHNMLRGPYDLANLGLIFGLSEEQTKNAISTACKNLLLHAESRKIGKVLTIVNTIIDVESIVLEDGEISDTDMEHDAIETPAFKKSKPNGSQEKKIKKNK